MAVSTRRRFFGFAAALLTLAAAPALAQDKGEVSGYVRDSEGGALAGATVTVAYPEIGVTRTAQAHADGLYVLTNLPVGTAELAAELTGFQRQARKNLAVNVGAKLRIDFTLPIGQIVETIEVTAPANAISTRADVAHLISGDQTKELAIDGRTYMQLLTLLPGVSSTGASYEFGTSLRADGQTINGLRNNFSGLTVDGGENLDAGSNATQVNNVSIDAIEEFKVMTSQYSAEHGRSAGAVINVVTRRGKKDFRGGAYGFLRNDAWDAENPLTGIKEDLDFKDFGWNLSGPVPLGRWKSDRARVFFFIGQEYKRLETQVGQIRTNVSVPSLLERRGDFSQSPTQPRDPLTGQPFPGGVIPAGRLSPAGMALANRFPAPDAGQRASATLRPLQDRDVREDIVRLDVRTGASSNLTVRFIRDAIDQLEPYGSFGGNSAFAQVPISHVRRSSSLVVNFTHNLGSSAIHEMSVSAVKNNQDLTQTGDNFQRAGIAVPEIFPANRLDRAPNITAMDGFAVGNGLFGADQPTHIIGNYYTIKNSVSLVRGRHSFKFGTYLNQSRKSETFRASDAGAFTFRNNRPGGSGVALGDLLLGLYATYTEAEFAPQGNYYFNQFEVYAQDHWQVRPNFTLDYGVRYQVMPGVMERDNLLATFDPRAYDPAQAPRINPANGDLVPGTGSPTNGIVRAGQGGSPRGLYATDWNNVAPRAGFTWDPWKNGRTSIRGGFGMYYDRPVINSTRDQIASFPLLRTVQVENGRVDNPAGGSSRTLAPSGFEALATDFPMPTVYSYSIGFQRELPWGLLADVGYVGNQARHLLRGRQLNYTPLPRPNPTASTNFNRVFQGYGGILLNETAARSEYNSLQVALNRRAQDGLAFGVSYTLAVAKGDQDQQDNAAAQNPLDLDAEFGYQDFDRRHVLVFNYIYRLPFFRDQKGVLGNVLGGWEVSGVTRLSSGRRFSVTAGNTTLAGDTTTLRANLVEGQDPNREPEGGRTTQRWFDTTAFARPAANTFGNSPRNVLVGPGYRTFDVSLFKNFLLAAKVKAQLRLEGFNVFNRANYTTLDTNVTSSNFGRVNTADPGRIVQLGMKVSF